MAGVGTTEKHDLTGLDDSLVKLIDDITDEYEKEDKIERDQKKSLWLKLEHYFHGRQRIYYNASTKDWSSIDKAETQRHYDKVINNYRAHAESIIAALSVKPPSAVFYPADADVEEDITTAKACTKIKSILERVNQSQLLIVKALLILFNQGVVAAYIYNRKGYEYGSYSSPKYAQQNKKVYSVLLNCAECGSNIEEIQYDGEKGKPVEESKTCAVCGFTGIPNTEEYEEEFPEVVGVTLSPKSKTCIDVYSPLFVYMPFYARHQEHMPYIRLRFENHYSMLKNQFPKLKKKGFDRGSTDEGAEDRGIFVGVNNQNLCTVDCWWIRPWALDVIDGKDKEIEKLKEKYPDGLYAIYIDDELVEVSNEGLDEHWCISNNPLDTYIHADPLGKSLAPIQDLQNELVDLQIETAEHAIPETFARPDVLDFKKYKNSRAAPGMVFPTLPADTDRSIGEAFHTVKPASLSAEYDAMLNRLDEKSQFVSAAFPSIYGGPSTSGSKTAREYTESRAMALQRLGLTWTMLKYWWADVVSKAVPQYIHAVRETGEDEKIVEKAETGFVNTWIRQAEIQGHIGRVEADADENLPLTPAQLKDTVMQLMTMKDDFVMDAITHPNNTPLLTKALGAPDFYIPNSDDRSKQFSEFADLLAGIPVEVKPYENHGVESEVCKSFICSPTGLMLKKSNPQGIQMIEEHMMQHTMMTAPPPGMEGTDQSIPPSPEVSIPGEVAKFPQPVPPPQPVPGTV